MATSKIQRRGSGPNALCKADSQITTAAAPGIDVPNRASVDPESQEVVSQLVDQIVPQDASRIEAARAIQKYLRVDGGFTYSLKLPETVKNEFGQDERPDEVRST